MVQPRKITMELSLEHTDYVQMVVELCQSLDGLNQWEQGFISNMLDQQDDGYSPNMRKKIEQA